MRLGDNLTKTFSITDIQFCVGIVLSNLGFPTIGSEIIEYETHKSYKIKDTRTTPSEILEKLDLAREIISDEINELAESESICEDYAAVKWYYTKPILKGKSTNSIHTTHNMHSVEDVIGGNKINELYNRVMKILFTYRSNQLLIPYISTTLFEKPFKAALNIGIRGHYKTNMDSYISKLTPSDYEILRNDFAKIYSNGLTETSDSFFTITGDPNSALCGSPIKLWYLNNPSSKVSSVLFGSGQDMEVSEGTVSRLNLKDVNEELNMNDIDFVSICRKIFDASDLLFSHGHQLVYDIFSHHCDVLMQTKLDEFRRSCSGIYQSINFSIAERSMGFCINETHRGKIMARIRYADYLNNRFQSSVAPSDLKDIRDNLYKITEQLKPSDGHRLFSTEDHTVNLAKSESQRIEILMNGYTAMHTLISYIERNEKRTGITIQDFPVTIFRDPAYLKRFKTFDEYIAGHDIVQQLLSEIRTSPDDTRRASMENGFFDNDTVGNVLATQESLSYIKEFHLLGEKSISFLYDVVHKKTSSHIDDLLADLIISEVNYLKNPWGNCYGDIPNLQRDVTKPTFEQMTYLQRLYYLNQLGMSFNDAFKNAKVDENSPDDLSNENDVSMYIPCILFLKLLELVQADEGYPVCDNGFFTISIDQMSDRINAYKEKLGAEYLSDDLSNEENSERKEELSEIIEQLSITFNMRLIGLLACADIIQGKKFTRSTADSFTDDDFQSLYFSYAIVKKYLDTSYFILNDLYEFTVPYSLVTKPAALKKQASSLAFTIAIEYSEYSDLMAITPTVNSAEDLNCLYSSDLEAYLDSRLTSDDAEERKEATKVNLKKTSEMLISFNRMLLVFKDSFVDFFNTFEKDIQIKLAPASKESSTSSVGLLARLEALDREILCDSYINSNEIEHAAKVISIHATSFNEYGFAMKDGQLLYMDCGLGRRYYHRSGFACLLYANASTSMSDSHSYLTDDDFEFISVQ